MIRQWYERPDEAVSVIITIDGEYNDETYDNRISHVGVYDSKGHEIHPIGGKEKAARKALREAAESDDLFRQQTEDPLEEVAIRLQTPELYVKE